jgi:hypothetical protein
MKIRPVDAELFHADERTDMTKLIVTFRNFANLPKNWWNAKQYGQNHLKECKFKYLWNLRVERDTLRARGNIYKRPDGRAQIIWNMSDLNQRCNTAAWHRYGVSQWNQ